MKILYNINNLQIVLKNQAFKRNMIYDYIVNFENKEKLNEFINNFKMNNFYG